MILSLRYKTQGVCLVLEVLTKLMVRENSSWEFPKVGVRLILEVCHIRELTVIFVIDGWGISCEITLRWLLLDFTDDK